MRGKTSTIGLLLLFVSATSWAKEPPVEPASILCLAQIFSGETQKDFTCGSPPAPDFIPVDKLFVIEYISGIVTSVQIGQVPRLEINTSSTISYHSLEMVGADTFGLPSFRGKHG